MNNLVAEFDRIIEEAPVDFLGTGSDSKWANKCEREWYEDVAAFREKLIDLIGKIKDE
jgi:hypothetical protein